MRLWALIGILVVAASAEGRSQATSKPPTTDSSNTRAFDFKGFRLRMTMRELDSVASASGCWVIRNVETTSGKWYDGSDMGLSDSTAAVVLQVGPNAPRPSCCRLGCYRRPSDTAELCVFHTAEIHLKVFDSRVYHIEVKSMEIPTRDPSSRFGDVVDKRLEAWVGVVQTAVTRQLGSADDSLTASECARYLFDAEEPEYYKIFSAWVRFNSNVEVIQKVYLTARLSIPESRDRYGKKLFQRWKAQVVFGLEATDAALERLKTEFDSRRYQEERERKKREQDEYNRQHPPVRPDF